MNFAIWIACAVVNTMIALLHIYIVYAGAPAYRFFGAGEMMAIKAEQGSLFPATITLGIAAVFFIFTFYNLSGAKIVNLPFSYIVLLSLSVIFLLRGAIVVAFPFWPGEISTFTKVTAFISLGIGLLHAAGVYYLKAAES